MVVSRRLEECLCLDGFCSHISTVVVSTVVVSGVDTPTTGVGELRSGRWQLV